MSAAEVRSRLEEIGLNEHKELNVCFRSDFKSPHF